VVVVVVVVVVVEEEEEEEEEDQSHLIFKELQRHEAALVAVGYTLHTFHTERYTRSVDL